MKILYALNNNYNARIQLSRYLKYNKHTIKIAGYKKSNIYLDWTLDCLPSILKSSVMTTETDNFSHYYDFVKYYDPDLIISDYEFFTSAVANLLNKPVIHCSSSFLNQGTKFKRTSAFSKYIYILKPADEQRYLYNNILDNSEHNYIYSHFCDVSNSVELANGFQWIRPYHSIGEISTKYNFTGAAHSNNRGILSLLKNNSQMFSFSDEEFKNIKTNSLSNEKEYFNSIKNSNLLICEGQMSFLADAYYNGKYSLSLHNFKDYESIISSCISESFGLGSCISIFDDITSYLNKKVVPTYSTDIMYLHELINQW